MHGLEETLISEFILLLNQLCLFIVEEITTQTEPAGEMMKRSPGKYLLFQAHVSSVHLAHRM